MTRLELLKILTMLGVVLTDLIERRPDDETLVDMNQDLRETFVRLASESDDDS